jgi:PAS domain-containing protein
MDNTYVIQTGNVTLRALSFQQKYDAMTNIQYSYSLGSMSVNTEAPEPLWSCHGIQIIPGPTDTVVVFNPKNDARLLVQSEVARALEHCYRFDTLAGHLDHLFDAMPPLREQPEDAKKILELVRDAGIFESADEAWQRLTARSDELSLEDGPVRLFILTCDRPEALERLLSALNEQPLPDHVEALFVIDDSRASESSVSNAAVIESARGNIGLPIHHIDMAARTELVSQLKATLPERQRLAIDFLLDRSYWGAAPTYGLARNLVLLLSVNYRALVMDDDILPVAMTPPLLPHSLSFETPRAREAVFYSSAIEMQQQNLVADFNPLTAMLRSLGQSLDQVLTAELSGANMLKGVDGRLTTTFSAESRVYLSQCGTWGDPGTSDSGWAFFQSEASIKRLLDSSSEPSEVLAARASWLGYLGPTIGSYGTLSQLTGLDHRALLPPYFPAGRGEDVLFGIMLQRLHPESAVLSEGWAVPHYPVNDRSSRGQLSPISVTASMMTLIDWLGRASRDEVGVSPQTRLLMVADEIDRLAGMETEALERLVQSELLSKRASLLALCIEHIDTLPRLDNLPGTFAWSTFLEQSRDHLLSQIQSSESQPIAEALRHAASDMESLRQIGADFAEAIKAWPIICGAAAALEIPQHASNATQPDR